MEKSVCACLRGGTHLTRRRIVIQEFVLLSLATARLENVSKYETYLFFFFIVSVP